MICCDESRLTVRNNNILCERCGATYSHFIRLCKKCNTETDKLYGLFVPHLCKECYDKLREEEIKHGYVCSFCRQPYIDCCC